MLTDPFRNQIIRNVVRTKLTVMWCEHTSNRLDELDNELIQQHDSLWLGSMDNMSRSATMLAKISGITEAQVLEALDETMSDVDIDVDGYDPDCNTIGLERMLAVKVISQMIGTL